MQRMSPGIAEPLLGHARYRKVRLQRQTFEASDLERLNTKLLVWHRYVT